MAGLSVHIPNPRSTGREAEIAQLQADIAAMIEAGATERDLNAYVAAHGLTPADLQAQGVAPVSETAVPPSQPQDLPPAMFAAMKGLAKGAAFPLDLAARGIGGALGAGASALGFDDLGRQLSNPATIGGGLDAAYPTPANQQGVDAVFQGLGGAGAGIGIGRGLAAGLEAAPGIGTVSQRIGASLAAQPGLQGVAGGTSALAVDAVRQGGGGTGAQLAAGLAAGVLPFGAAAGIGAAGRATVAPLTEAYVREGAAALMRESATDPALAARYARAGGTSQIPGVKLTTGEASRDPGLAALQRSLSASRSSGGESVQSRAQDNMMARAGAIDTAMGPGNASALTAAAETEAARLDAATQGAVGRVGPVAAADVSGDALRADLQARAAAAKQQASAQYDNLPGGDEPLQVGALDPASYSMDGLPRALPEDAGSRAAFEAGGKASQAPVAAVRQRGLFSLIAKRGVNVNGELAAEMRAAGIKPRDLPGVFRTNGGVSSADELLTPAREEGFIADIGAGVDDVSGADITDMLLNDIRAMGKGGAGQRVTNASREAESGAAREAQSNADWWDREFQARGLDPQKMNAEDWDGMYRDVEGLGPRPVTQDDMEFLGASADNADGMALLSPFQSSLIGLQRQFFPAGLPPKSGVAALIGQLTKADVLTTKQVERIVRDLRRQAGLLKASDGISAGLAKAAANAGEGFLMTAAGPERAAALKAANEAWKAYAGTFKNGEPGKALATDQFGRNTMDAARVPGAVVPKGVTGGTAARRLTDAGGPVVAEKAAREEVRRALDAAGADAGRVARVEADYAATLAEYPALAGDVRAARESAAMAERFARSAFGKLRTAESPTQAVFQAVRAQDDGAALRAIRAAVRGNPDAEAGLRRALADYVVPPAGDTRAITGNVTRAGDPVQSNLTTWKTLDAVLRKTAGTGLLSREQRGVLINVRRELKGQQFANSANRAPGSDTARNVGVAARIGKLALHGVSPGAGKAAHLLELVIGALGNAKGIGDMVHEAMLDPKLAAALLEAPTPARAKALGERLTSIIEGSATGAAAATKEPAK